ncbi:MAG: adenylate/guanylate cyclase domain-containing protein [Betaproteobacteria bacterium]|nr:MAG: adenylate/guanylate cyclase domain-containing protein [Betaproteobacteria bacterium]
MIPQTHYAKCGDVSIAYQVFGEGGIDLVFVPGWVSNVEIFWEEPAYARFLKRLATFSRVILFDKRGTGLSDRVSEMPNVETRMDDVRAVMDAVQSEHAVLFGYSEGGVLCALFAATYPDRTTALIMHGSYARLTRRPDYPWGPTDEERAAFNEDAVRHWGEAIGLDQRAPSMAHDQRFRDWWARYLRLSASPAAFEMLSRMNMRIDIRNVLPAIRVPTLVLHSVNDETLPVEGSRYIARQIPDARLVELAGSDHVPWLEDAEAVCDEIEEFLTGVRRGPETDRVLATVLFTDIVGSSERAAELGDRAWRDLLENHHSLVRRELERFRGREIDTAGDGFLATFDGPARAIRCAMAILEQVRSLGIGVRAGLHTGECEKMGEKLGGIAVHIGARVMALAKPGEVMVSSTVKDLVAGSGLSFEDRDTHTLKGIPGEWHLFSVRF